MKFAMYKPFKPILFDDEEDTSSWSRELTNFMKLLVGQGHSFTILSKTDCRPVLAPDGIAAVPIERFGESVDVLFISNGNWSANNMSEEEVIDSVKAKKVVLLATDLSLVFDECNQDLYDEIWSQTKFPISPKWKYAHLEKMFLVGEEIPKGRTIRSRKSRTGVFIGSERERLADVLEFVWRPEFEVFGKFPSLHYNHRTYKSETKNLLLNRRFSMVIADPIYYTYGFVTQRYWENCVHGCINFVYCAYDLGGLCLPLNDDRRVADYLELRQKITEFDFDKMNKIQLEQYAQVKPWLDGQKLAYILKKRLIELFGDYDWKK